MRDGTQREGLTVSLTDKLKIARRLDDFGMPFIEGGWPGSNPKDSSLAAKGMTWRNARIAAFGFTRNRANRVEDDANIRALIDAETPVITLVGKSWLMHVTDVLGATPDENLAMIGDTVAFCRKTGREGCTTWSTSSTVQRRSCVREGLRGRHRTPAPRRSSSATRTAARCPTTLSGSSMPRARPSRASRAPRRLTGGFASTTTPSWPSPTGSPRSPPATARSGTINGYGERCGNANLVSILANLELKTDYPVVPSGKVGELTDLSLYVAEIVNLNPDDHQPYVGRSAFAHKGGIHGAATAKVEMSYQHIDPRLVGNESRLVVSELGGKANTRLRAEQLGHRLEGIVDPKELSQLVKRLESEGASFEGAEASFELLIRRYEPGYSAPFDVLDFTVIIGQREGQELRAEATVKVEVEGEVLHTAADGNGPVNALDAAMRKALRAFYPQLDGVHLVDYKVRIVDSAAATAARTRVVIESATGADTSSTVGSDTNIIMVG